jgi:hypothetical protein
MTTVEEIEEAVEKLSPDALAKFRAWFEAFEAARFDRAIEQDAQSGKLNGFAEEALRDYRATPAELSGIERGLRDSANGRFASEDAVEAVFAKHRPG